MTANNDRKNKEGAGRPSEMEKGGPRRVYLDAKSVEIAKELGHGNVSDGIRAALKAYAAGRS